MSPLPAAAPRAYKMTRRRISTSSGTATALAARASTVARRPTVIGVSTFDLWLWAEAADHLAEEVEGLVAEAAQRASGEAHEEFWGRQRRLIAAQTLMAVAAHHTITALELQPDDVQNRCRIRPEFAAVVIHLRHVWEHWDEQRDASEDKRSMVHLRTIEPFASPFYVATWSATAGAVLAQALSVRDLRAWLASVQVVCEAAKP